MLAMAGFDEDASSSIPGNAGFPIFGDKSYEFYANPVKFVEDQMKEHNSHVFMTRLLNKPTVVICSNTVAQEMLLDQTNKVELGYKSFMGEVYSDNILFTDGALASNLRLLLSHIFSHENMNVFQTTIDRIILKSLTLLNSSTAGVPVYTFFKQVMTEICLSLFLDLDFDTSSDLAEAIVSLTTTHWHGIISVPVNFKVPVMNKSSTFGKAIQAKEKLTWIIKEKLCGSQNGFLKIMLSAKFPTEEAVVSHILLFTSALVPKALASILTSFIIGSAHFSDDVEMTMKSMQASNQYLENVLLEAMRLWPPFPCGRRLIRKDFDVLGYKLCKGWAAIYFTYFIHRDPSVFSQPDKFIPERWISCNKNDEDKLVSFGCGARGCIGKHLAWNILKKTASILVSRYNWQIPEGQDLSYKWLPVSRPKNDVVVCFKPIEDQNANT